MISPQVSFCDPLENERLLVVAAGQAEADLLRGLSLSYPQFTVVSRPSYLSGVAEAASQTHRAVLAWVETGMPHARCAIRGLRSACGDSTKLLLCCVPEHEPFAREMLGSGADDYVVYPLEGCELDSALGYARKEELEALGASGIDADGEQGLRRISEVIESIDAGPSILLQQLAKMIMGAVPATGVMLVVEGEVTSAGTAVSKPVLTAPIEVGGRALGHVAVGDPKGRAYTPADVERLTLYSGIAARLLETASSSRHYRRLAMTDECTGLPNRRYFQERLDAILASAGSERLPVSVLVFDVDDFKAYNDAFGHDGGDRILRGMGALFVKQCRQQDVVARYGGDEFAVIFWDPEGPRQLGSSHPDCAFDVLDRVQSALRSGDTSLFGPEPQGSVTISGGLATFPWDATTRDGLIKKADEALLAAKRAGKNRIMLIGRESGGG